MSLSNTVFYFDSSTVPFTFFTSDSTISYATYSSQMTTGVTMIGVDIGTSCDTIADNCFNQVNVKDKLLTINFLTGLGSNLIIGDRAFYQLNNSTSNISVVFPARLVSLGDSCFYDSSRLTSITFSGTNLTTILNSCFDTCNNLASAITIPSSVTNLGTLAFYDCASIPSVTFGNGSTLTSIPEGSFGGCTSLTSVSGIPNSVTTIDRIAFQNCTSLSGITFPTGLTAIGEIAFHTCTSLTNITIPEGVTEIGNYAFEECLLLSTINLPSTLTTIGESTFYNVGKGLGITSITFNLNSQTQMTDESLINSKVFQNASGLLTSYPLIVVNAYNVPGAPSNPTLTPGFTKLFNSATQNISAPIFNYFSSSSCFDSNTCILCYDPIKKKECWCDIDTLKQGDFVKTCIHGYCSIYIIGWNQCKNIITKSGKYRYSNMYISKDKNNQLKVTGGHGIMKTSQEMEMMSIEKINENSAVFDNNVPIIENHTLFLTCLNDEFEELPDGYLFKYYHFVLENPKDTLDSIDDQDKRYCVWARDKNSNCTTGILTETPSKNQFREHNYTIVN